jgi:hypothetical protein
MTMTAQTKESRPDVSPTSRQALDELRALFADAPEMARTALEEVIKDVAADRSDGRAAVQESAGRIGLRQGKVSELTVYTPITPDGAVRLRAALQLAGAGTVVNRVGTLHNLRFVFLENDTKMLFATAYDGDWDDYINDFATKIPAYMDLLFSAVPGWPGINSPSVKDFIVSIQVPASRWYVASPDLTVVETRRLERLGKAVDEFLDKVGS